jgi:uncharacterized protein (TIGR02284 family)
VTALGGKPAEDGTIAGGAHRLFLDLKSLVTGHDDKAIINEVEAGEDHIKAEFEDALQEKTLSPAVRARIEIAYGKVKSGHDEMRDLKHSMQD